MMVMAVSDLDGQILFCTMAAVMILFCLFTD